MRRIRRGRRRGRKKVVEVTEGAEVKTRDRQARLESG
jgi:hypothetical protein